MVAFTSVVGGICTSGDVVTVLAVECESILNNASIWIEDSFSKENKRIAAFSNCSAAGKYLNELYKIRIMD